MTYAIDMPTPEKAVRTDGGLNAIVRVDDESHAVRVFRLPASTGYTNLNTATFDRRGARVLQFDVADRTDRWLQIMGPAGTDGLDLAQDARALVAHLTHRGQLDHEIGRDRAGYMYVSVEKRTLSLARGADLGRWPRQAVESPSYSIDGRPRGARSTNTTPMLS